MSTESPAAVEVFRSMSVPLSQALAYELFTARMTEFWPKEHSTGSSEIAEVVIEPRPGGRWFERGVDGNECQWGRVATWDPPRRVVLLWQIGADWQFDPGFETEVEVEFIAQLTELMRSCIRPRGLTAGFGGTIALVDGMIHQQDIRRPLGIARKIPEHRLKAVLNYALTVPAVRGAKRARGVRLVASDLDWNHGSGPEVRGPGEALLMCIAARPAALDQLDRPGKSQLAQRIRR